MRSSKKTKPTIPKEMTGVMSLCLCTKALALSFVPSQVSCANTVANILPASRAPRWVATYTQPRMQQQALADQKAIEDYARKLRQKDGQLNHAKFFFLPVPRTVLVLRMSKFRRGGSGYSHCAFGWMSDYKGYWYHKTETGCGTGAGYRDGSNQNPAGAYCCHPAPAHLR